MASRFIDRPVRTVSMSQLATRLTLAGRGVGTVAVSCVRAVRLTGPELCCPCSRRTRRSLGSPWTRGTGASQQGRSSRTLKRFAEAQGYAGHSVRSRSWACRRGHPTMGTRAWHRRDSTLLRVRAFRSVPRKKRCATAGRPQRCRDRRSCVRGTRHAGRRFLARGARRCGCVGPRARYLQARGARLAADGVGQRVITRHGWVTKNSFPIARSMPAPTSW